MAASIAGLLWQLVRLIRECRGRCLPGGARVCYYPALQTGITHASIDYANAIDVLDGLQKDPARVSTLVENARRVDAELGQIV